LERAVTAVHVGVGALAIALCGGVGALGAWRWFRGEPSERFWPLLRAAQAALGVQALLGVLLLLFGHKPKANLHVLYGVLPLVVMFFAEQLRIASAQQVLDARGLDRAEDVGGLPEAEQRSVVLQIVRREMGVMAAAALVCLVLALRAAGTAGAL
jgi:hypothetical protein